MVDFIFALGQVLCIVGLLYGAYLSITYAPEENNHKRRIRFDPVTTHIWSAPAESLEDRLRRFS